jgi:hypothetical protein
MKALLACCALAGVLLVTPARAASVTVNLGNAPPAPTITVEPRWTYVPEQRVYVVSNDLTGVDYDLFRVGNSYWIYSDGYWYRASNWSGPFIAVRQSTVPRQIFRVSSNAYQWRHMPPGQMKVKTKTKVKTSY